MIILKNISCKNISEYRPLGKYKEVLSQFNVELPSNSLLCINGGVGSGAALLPELITGKKTAKCGDIMIDGSIKSKRDLQDICCFVGVSSKKFFKLFSIYNHHTIRKVLSKGIDQNNLFDSVEQVKDLFYLSEERLDRKMWQLSGERWKAGIAIGYVYKKKIFCFPWLDPQLFKIYKDFWKKNIFNTLLKNGCTIIIPTKYDEEMKDYFDVVINLSD